MEACIHTYRPRGLYVCSVGVGWCALRKHTWFCNLGWKSSLSFTNTLTSLFDQYSHMPSDQVCMRVHTWFVPGDFLRFRQKRDYKSRRTEVQVFRFLGESQ